MKETELLIIEDNHAELAMIKRCLEKIKTRNFSIQHKPIAKEALKFAKENIPDLILLDHLLPGRKKIEFLRECQNQNMYIPILILTGRENDRLQFYSLQEAADDFLLKRKLTPDLLSHSINKIIKQAQNQFQNDLKAMELEMACDTHLDFLTGLHNQEILVERINTQLRNNAETGKSSLYLVLIEIKGLRKLSDPKDFRYGNELLQKIGEKLTIKTSENDFVARFGRNEFCVVLSTSNQIRAKEKQVEIQQDLNELFSDWCEEQTTNSNLKPKVKLHTHRNNSMLNLIDLKNANFKNSVTNFTYNKVSTS